MNEVGIEFDVLEIGEYPVKNNLEDDRCGGLWNPPDIAAFINSERIIHFNSIADNKLCSFVKKNAYDVGIQGGVGIIKKALISSFNYGILNLHPGDLPKYRGCSAPEWQLYEHKPIICTCHLVDEGIDSGPIFRKKKLFDYNDVESYFKMRSTLYQLISVFLTEILIELDDGFLEYCYNQEEKNAVYRKYIGNDIIEELKKRFR